MYSSLQACVRDLERHGHLIRITEEVDGDLEAAEVHRRINRIGGPALYFERIKGSEFPALSNLFGTAERGRFLFRKTRATVQQMIAGRADPAQVLRRPLKLPGLGLAALKALPARRRSGSVLYGRTTIERLPAIRSWPDDGGPFITLPQVFTLSPDNPSVMKSNLGMYRIQLSGNSYRTNEQVGLHYQIHRGIGVHHTRALELGQPLKVSIFVGGPPAHSFAAVMPLPEGLPELAFGGALAGRRFRYIRTKDGHILSADADFCITGTIEPDTLPEGPFGDHLGYYSLQHDFPVLKVDAVYHRKDAVWPFTVVGRPPQEDSIFGKLIGELTGPMVPASIPGLRAMRAVDEAGVHPLLLAVGSERYTPYERNVRKRPQELLTIANAILGFNQASLAKYLWIAAGEDDPQLDLHDTTRFFGHMLARVDWERDLHFQTRTTIDTLDYSGDGLNEGSKVVIAASGTPRRELASDPVDIRAEGCGPMVGVMPGVFAVSGPAYRDRDSAGAQVAQLAMALEAREPSQLEVRPLVILCDDADFLAASMANFVWATFTRSNPAADVYGTRAFTQEKHWGCKGTLIIDARIKPWHAPPLLESPEVNRRVDRLFAAGASLHGLDG